MRFVGAIVLLSLLIAAPAGARGLCHPREKQQVRRATPRFVLLENHRKRVIACARANGRRTLIAYGHSSFDDDLLTHVHAVAGRFLAYSTYSVSGAPGSSYDSRVLDVLAGDSVEIAYGSNLGGSTVVRVRLRRDGLVAAGLNTASTTAPYATHDVVACRFDDCRTPDVLAEDAAVRVASVRLGHRICWQATRRECSPLPPRGPGRRCRPRGGQRVSHAYPTVTVLAGRQPLACLRRTGQRRRVPSTDVEAVRGRVIAMTDGTAVDVASGASAALGSDSLSVAIAADGRIVADADHRVVFCRLPSCTTVAEGDVDLSYLAGDQGCWVRRGDADEYYRVECAPLPQ